MAETIDIAGLIAYPGQRENALIGQVFSGLTAAQDMTVYGNIKSKKLLTKLTAGSVMRPFKNVFEATDSSLAYSDRALETTQGKGEWLLDPREYRETWMEQYLAAGAENPDIKAIPFAAWTWNQIMLKAAEDINLNTVWNGVHNPAGSTAADIANGLHTILKADITAGKIAPVATGDMTVDTVAKIEALYKSFDPKYRGMDMFAYCSYKVYDAYRENYRARFGGNNDYDGFLAKPVSGSDGKLILKPVLWMGASDRVMITPKANIMLGTDRLSDLNTVRALGRMYVVEAAITLTIGFQFRDLEVLKVNERN